MKAEAADTDTDPKVDVEGEVCEVATGVEVGRVEEGEGHVTVGVVIAPDKEVVADVVATAADDEPEASEFNIDGGTVFCAEGDSCVCAAVEGE